MSFSAFAASVTNAARRAGAALALAACAAPPPVSIPQNDPHEAQNRAVHEFNKAIDSAIVRPASMVFGEGAPGPISEAIDNAADNLRAPRSIINMVLQARFADAVHMTSRFAINSTVGIGGLFDPAGAMGLDERKTDFGVTLHTWGVGEGDFVELPLVSASTQRDTLGKVVDIVIDPVGWIFPNPYNWAARGLNIVSSVRDRARFARVIDSILYESADSYAQTRLLYLQNRRFELGQEASDDDFFDPYED
ncbi:MAG: VacJ family lipoprotein [Gemmobacter sp.]